MEHSAPNPETSGMRLRDVETSDLPIFFEQQLDEDANYMAAVTRKDRTDRDAFMAHWNRILGNETITIQTILFDDQVAGSVSIYENEEGNPEVTYWLGKPYWGKGIATSALSALLLHVKTRPLYARVVKDNAASLRVLEKCGFTRIGEGKVFANARGKEIEEFILRLD